MSNFMSNDNATAVLTPYANAIKSKKDVFSKKYQSSNILHNHWYRLFQIGSTTTWNVVHLRILVTAGYASLYEAFLCLRFTPDGIDPNDTYAEVISSRATYKDIKIISVNSSTFGVVVKNLGNDQTVDLEILEYYNEQPTLFIMDDPFSDFGTSEPTAFGSHRYLTGSYNDLLDKPTLGTAAAKDVPVSGDASLTQVVMGDDSRLTDARNAADVSAWAKAANKPAYTASEVGAIALTDAMPKTATDNFKTINGGLLDKLKVKFEPVQNLNGYSKPWPGGAGKNKLPNNGVSTYTAGSLTFTKQADGSVLVNGTNDTGNTVNYFFNVENTAGGTPCFTTLAEGTYLLTGCPSGGGPGSWSYALQLYYGGNTSNTYGDSFDTRFDFGEGMTVVANSGNNSNVGCRICVADGKTLNNLVFKPMLRLASIADPTFEPYSNICPISGHTQVKSAIEGKNFAKSVSIIGSVQQYVTALCIDTEEDLLPNTQYTISFKNDGGIGNILYTNENIFTTDTSVTVQSGLTYVTVTTKAVLDRSMAAQYSYGEGWKIFKNRVTQSAITVYKDVQLEKGSEATDYEPYVGQTHTTSLGSTYYGGDVDMVSGEGEETIGRIDLGSLTYQYESSLQRFNADLTGMKLLPQRTMRIKSDIYQTIDDGRTFDASWDNVIYNNNNSANIIIHNHAYSDAAAFKTAMSGYYITYDLATPTTLTLTGQNIPAKTGVNNISAPLDGQEIDTDGVVYKELFTFEDVMRVIGS